MIAGSLEIQMAMNLARLADDMQKSKSIVGGTMASIEASVASAKSALGALGIGFGVGYFVTLIKGSIDANAHLEDLKKSTNISVENLAGLRLIAKQAGGDIDSMALSINRLAVNMGKSPEKFQALGVSAKDPLEAFKQLSDIFRKLEDPEQRAAVMAAALGKAWFGAAPALALGSEKIGEMVERGTRLSGVTEENAQQAKLFHDKWVELVGTGGLLTRMIGPMLPLLNTLADSMLKVGDRADGLKLSFSPLAEFLKVLVVMGANLSFMFDTLGKDIARAIENVQLIAKGDFAGSRALGELFRKDAAAARAALDAYTATIMGSGLTGKPAPGAPAPKPDAATAAAAARFLGGKADAKLWAEYLKGLEQQVSLEEKANKAQTDFNEANSVAQQNAKFQLDTIGLTSVEIEKLTIARKMDLAAIEAEGKVIEGPFSDQFRAIVEEAKAAKKASLDLFDAIRAKSREWDTGMKSAFNDYIDHATNAAEQSSFVFSNAFKSIEDAEVDFLMRSEVNWRNVANSIIANLIRVQVQQANAGMLGLIGGLFGAAAGPEQLSGPGMSFATGTDFVPRTGLAMVHQGEKIIPAGKSTGDTYIIDARGADSAGLARLEAMILSVNGSIEHRAIGAVANFRTREPAGALG